MGYSSGSWNAWCFPSRLGCRSEHAPRPGPFGDASAGSSTSHHLDHVGVEARRRAWFPDRGPASTMNPGAAADDPHQDFNTDCRAEEFNEPERRMGCPRAPPHRRSCTFTTGGRVSPRPDRLHLRRGAHRRKLTETVRALRGRNRLRPLSDSGPSSLPLRASLALSRAGRFLPARADRRPTVPGRKPARREAPDSARRY